MCNNVFIRMTKMLWTTYRAEFKSHSFNAFGGTVTHEQKQFYFSLFIYLGDTACRHGYCSCYLVTTLSHPHIEWQNFTVLCKDYIRILNNVSFLLVSTLSLTVQLVSVKLTVWLSGVRLQAYFIFSPVTTANLATNPVGTESSLLWYKVS
jgi:hypothetical protein